MSNNVTVYVVTQWANLPNKTSPLDATALNHIETGIKNVTDFINTLDAEAGVVLCQVAFTNALKNKLDGIEAGANNYTLPTASINVKGGVIVDGTTITIDQNGVISASGGNLSTLLDVSLDDLEDGQILKYDAQNGLWINASGGEVQTQLSLLEDVNVDNVEDGQVLQYDAQNELWVPGEPGNVLSYDETINVLGVL